MGTEVAPEHKGCEFGVAVITGNGFTIRLIELLVVPHWLVAEAVIGKVPAAL
jgi:hypothetical protein